MKKYQKLSLYALALTLVGFGFSACDDDDDKLNIPQEELAVTYPKQDGQDYNGRLLTVKSKIDGKWNYSTVEDNGSKKPELTGKLTSIVVKSAISATDTLEASSFEVGKLEADFGIIKLEKGSEVKPGVYNLALQLSTIYNSVRDEEAYKLNVVETSMSYSDKTAYINKAFKSNTPVITGGVSPTEYSLVEAPDGFTIDEKTGVISAVASAFPEATDIVVGVKVTYEGGTITYNGAMELTVIKEIITPSDLVYESKEITEGSELSVQPTVTGNELKFSFVGDTPDAFKINEETGEISLEKGNALEVGVITLKVKAENSKGETEGSFQLTITEKGNAPENLVYANSTVRIATRSDFASDEPTIDNGDGVSYSIDDDTNFTIDAATGVISYAKDYVAGGTYNLKVTATNKLGTAEADYTINVLEMKYANDPLEGDIATGITADIPQTINFDFEAGGKIELKGIYYSGTLNGTEYKDVLLIGGTLGFVDQVPAVSDALGFTHSKGGKVDLNIPRREMLGQAKNTDWDGSIKSVVNSSVLKPGNYVLRVRYTDPSGNANTFDRTLTIVLK